MVGKRAALNGRDQIAGSGAAAGGSSSLQRLENKWALDDEPELYAAAAAQIQISSARVPKPTNLRPCSATATQAQILSSPGTKSRSSHHKLRPCSAAAAQVRFLIPSSSWGAKAKRSRTAVSRRDWANLGDGPAGLIAERVLANEVADYIRFRAVCGTWRRSCADPRSRGVLEDRRFLPRRWIMLLGDKENLDAAAAPHLSRRHFLNASTGQCIQVDVPELRDHGVLGSSTEGLLVLFCKTNGAVRLLNPLTRQTAELPPFTSLQDDGFRPGYIGNYRPSNVNLLEDRTILVRYFSNGGTGTLAVAKPGDKRWVLFRNSNNELFPTTTFAGRFYGVSDHAVMVLDTSGGGEGLPPRLVVAAELTLPLQRMMDTVHLVDNGGELMLVHRLLRGRAHPDNRQQNEFKRNNKRMYKVYRVNLERGKTMPARSLRGRAIFIGLSRALSVSPQVFPSIDANTIYPGLALNERGGDEQIGAYHLRDGSAQSFNFDRKSGPEHPWSIVDCLAAYASG